MKKRISNSKFSACRRQNTKSDRGFTLLELLVAMTLFLVLMGMAVGGFVRALRTQRAALELMSVNDNAVLTLEQMIREIRTGYDFNKSSESQLDFTNARGLAVSYRLNGTAIEKGLEDVDSGIITYQKITADNVKVLRFAIYIMGNDPLGDGYPPRVTISLSLTGTNKYLEDVSTNIQTTASSRALD